MKSPISGDNYFSIVHLKWGGKRLKICGFSINTNFLNAIDFPDESELFVNDPAI